MAEDLIGLKFGRLTVIAKGEKAKSGKNRWICKCDCGKTKAKHVLGHDLKSGRVRSCGCIYKDSNKGRNKIHGESNTRLHRIWCSMKQRCNYVRNVEYLNYGGRGITYSSEWELYENFREWALTNGYQDNLTLDRIDTNGNYTPENCRWATMKQQQNNRRNTIFLTYKGEKQPITTWAEITGISASTLTWRLKNGWSESEMFIPVNFNNKKIRRKKYE